MNRKNVKWDEWWSWKWWICEGTIINSMIIDSTDDCRQVNKIIKSIFDDFNACITKIDTWHF